jgi:predicted ATPase/DNA-binding CsgD family transcriptional regulator
MIKNYLHPQLNAFVGRKKELADVSARLLSDECRLLTLTGLGGSGKTRLAIEAANSVTARFPQGSVFVNLQPLTRSDLLVATIAQALGLTFYGEDEPRQQLLNYLHHKSLLLVLDNFEHLLNESVLVSEILAHAGGVKLLVTSREALNLQEEWLYPLKGMSIPPSIYSTSLEDYEAVELFMYHARRIRPDFDLSNEHEPVISICEMTVGLPLAIELAASWLKGSNTAQIAREMRFNLDFLSTNMRNIEERHRSMRAVFDQSWKLMSENERLIFARLCVFKGGFDKNAAVQVAGASFSSLAALVEKSLVQMVSPDRFGIHAMLDQYGVEKLESYGETEATHARHRRYFAQLMLQHETALQQPQQIQTMQAIESDFENIRLAWEWSTKHQEVSNLQAMLNGLYLFGFLRSRYRETIPMFQYTLDQLVTDTPFFGKLLARRWGYLHWGYQTDDQEAFANIEKALAITLAENDPFEFAFCQLMTGYAMINMQRYTEALSCLETSKSMFEAINQPYYVCWTLHRMGYAYSNLNNRDKGNEYTEQSLLLARSAHNRVALVICLYNLGSNYILYSDYIKGRRYCEEALQVANELGHQGQIAHSLSLVALCAFFQGDYEICQEYAERSQAINKVFNFLIFQAYSVTPLILLACLREEYDEAARLSELGKYHRTNTMGFQLLYWALAALACGLGNATEARVNIQKLLEVTEPHANSVTSIWIVPSVVCTLAETNPKKATELLSWVFTYSDLALNWVRQWSVFERLHTHLQAVMGLDAFQALWEKGKSLTPDAVTAYVQHEFRTTLHAADDEDQQHLTAREIEVLQLLAAGLTNPQIAEMLVIGVGTVKTHTLNIYRKLDVANRTQAIVHAQELGLLHA